MPITVTFTADTVEELHWQLQDLLIFGTFKETPGTAAPEKPLQEVAVQKAAKPAKAPKAPTLAPVAEPEPLIEVTGEETPTLVEADNTKAMLKLKDDTIAKLQQAFADGKVKKLRTLLEDHGGGAKSFPEVAIENFPKIAQQIESGALN